MSKLDGTSKITYETKKTKRMTEYWVDERLKSAANPAVLAFLGNDQCTGTLNAKVDWRLTLCWLCQESPSRIEAKRTAAMCQLVIYALDWHYSR